MKRLILNVFFVLLVFSPVYSQKPAYVGAKECKDCHSGPQNGHVYEKWTKNVHAKAFEVLKKKGEDKNPRCLGCHVTGFGDGGYRVGAANAADFEGVQCESCHGKGSVYKELSIMKQPHLAVENGLIFPVEALCTKCHNKACPTFKGFDYKEAVKIIDHIHTDKPVRKNY